MHTLAMFVKASPVICEFIFCLEIDGSYFFGGGGGGGGGTMYLDKLDVSDQMLVAQCLLIISWTRSVLSLQRKTRGMECIFCH